jgi:hypothetical protein
MSDPAALPGKGFLMSRFYVSAQGARGETTRTGTPNSGIVAHVRGWDIGIPVHGWDDNGVDVFGVYRTGGSNGSVESHIGTVRDDRTQVDVRVPA